MSKTDDRIPIVKGITMTPMGEVSIDPALDERLCDLAIEMQGPDDLPVDVEHVVAALILASREAKVPEDYELKPRDRSLKAILRPHIRTIFQRYGGRVCEEEDLQEEE
ncbi:MAG: hypothetical protein M3552_01345 [Planctomycetota bacterium]|nr:hypothetical protein [Planctomycetaceae bacterium]MDQ3329290.1 hypothetical protein [Planctomycetota bacterium]